MARFSFAEKILGAVAHGCFHTRIQPLRRQPEIPTPSHVIFFPRTLTWAIPEGRRRYLCDPGLVSFWSRGQVCLREPAASGEVDGEWFAFAPDVAAELVAEADPGALWSGRWLFRRQSAAIGAELFGRQRRLAAAIQAGRCERDQAVEAILCLATDCLRLGAPTGLAASTERRDRELVEAIRLQIARDPAARSGLAEMARGAGVGMVTLCTSFRRMAGRFDPRLPPRPAAQAGAGAARALDRRFVAHRARPRLRQPQPFRPALPRPLRRDAVARAVRPAGARPPALEGT